jgi:hypothetical protein
VVNGTGHRRKGSFLVSRSSPFASFGDSNRGIALSGGFFLGGGEARGGVIRTNDRRSLLTPGLEARNPVVLPIRTKLPVRKMRSNTRPREKDVEATVEDPPLPFAKAPGVGKVTMNERLPVASP